MINFARTEDGAAFPAKQPFLAQYYLALHAKFYDTGKPHTGRLIADVCIREFFLPAHQTLNMNLP